MLLGLGGVPRPAWSAPPPIIDLQGRGVQIYTCSAAPEGFAWRLKAPEATLTDPQGHTFGHHFAGPSWQATDGSIVVGEAIASATSMTAIPWVLLRVKSHSGRGVLAGVGFIVRSHTAGGMAPSAGCDGSHAGREARVDYSAEYTLFPSASGNP